MGWQEVIRKDHSFYRSFVIFQGVVFLANFLLAGLAAALLVLFLLSVLNIIARKWIWNRFPATAPDPLEQFFFGSILGLGFHSLLWTFFALFLTGKTRGLAVLLCLFCLAAIPCKKKTQAQPVIVKSQSPWNLVFILVILLGTIYFPFRNLGKETASGYAYRAYFADYLKHFCMTNAVTRQAMPPENPYFKGKELHYYWMPYAFPSLLLSFNGDVQKATVAFGVTVDYLLLGALLLLALSLLRGRCKNYVWAYFIMLIPVLFQSLEGFYLIFCKIKIPPLHHFLPLTTAYNIDGLTRWWWHTPQVDTLLRTLIYTPQAAQSLCFFVMYLVLRQRREIPSALAPVLLVFSLFANILVGSAFMIFYGVDFLYSAVACWRRKQSFNPVWIKLIYIILFTVLAVIILLGLKIISGDSNKFIIQPISLSALVPFLMLNFGLLLILGLIGGLLVIKTEPYFFSIGLIALIVCTVQISGFANDVSLKLSLPLSIILLAALVEVYIWFSSRSRVWSKILLLMFFFPGVYSSLIDIYNSTDIANRRFTVYVPRREMVLMQWARKSLPVNAIVQDFPLARQGDSSNIPAFAARQPYIGDSLNGRLFFVSDEAYFARASLLKGVLADLPARQGELKATGIQYVFWGLAEQKFFGYIPKMKIKKSFQGIYLFEVR